MLLAFTPMGIEQRRTVRFPTDFPVICRWKDGEHEGRALNLSAGGILISVPAPIGPGRILDISFDAGGEAISLRAIVRHSSQERGHGVEFVEVLPREQARLASYLRALSQPGAAAIA